MKVKDLIEELQKQDPDMDVLVQDRDSICYDIGRRLRVEGVVCGREADDGEKCVLISCL
jgi:hypothetical protein